MKTRLLFFVTIAMVIAGCSKIDLDELSKQSVGTSLATPIGTIDATVWDVYKMFDTIITPEIGEDNTVFLYWEQPISIDKFDFKDFTSGDEAYGSYSLSQTAGLLPKKTFYIRDTLLYSFNFNEASATKTYAIDSILIKRALFDLGITVTDLQLDENTYIEAEVKFPTLSTSGLAFRAIVTTNEMSIERQTGYFMASFAGSLTNTVPMLITFKLVSDGTKTVTSNSAISYTAKFRNIDYDVVHGYFYSKNPICSNHTTIKLDNTKQLYDFVAKNTVNLYNPEIIINLTTNVGTDAAIHFNSICAITKKGQRTTASFNGVPYTTQAIKIAQRPHATAETEIKFDRNYGNTHELFKKIPDSLTVDWDLYLGATDSVHNDFMVNPIKVDGTLATRIPMWFDKGTDIHFADTLDADLTSINGDWINYVNIKKFQVFLKFQNTLPMQAEAEVTFLDFKKNVLYIAHDIEIACPRVDEYGRSTEIAEKEVVLEFTGEEVRQILQTKKIAVSYVVGGYDEESTINFHATDGLRVKVSAYATMTVSIPNTKE